MGMYRDCYKVNCANLDSGIGKAGCKYYGYDDISEASNISDFSKYWHGNEDAGDCPGYKDNSCFMTTACVDYMGKADDCVELSTLRKFRDEKLANMKGGKALIKEYYDVAPSVVNAINRSEKKDRYYQDIYNTITLCVKNIDEKNDDEAVRLYLKMFNKYRILFGK